MKDTLPIGMKRKTSGFTLIELLVVIGIMGFLVAALVVVVPLMLDGAKKGGTTATLGRLKMALIAYKAEFGHYPDTGGRNITTTSLPDAGIYAYLSNGADQWNSIYVLWHGHGRDASGWGTHTNMKAPLPGQIKTPQGKLVGPFLQDKDLSFDGGDAYKRWPLDSWQRPIYYTLWRPQDATSPYDPYCILISKGADEDDHRDDIVVKGNE